MNHTKYVEQQSHLIRILSNHKIKIEKFLKVSVFESNFKDTFSLADNSFRKSANFLNNLLPLEDSIRYILNWTLFFVYRRQLDKNQLGCCFQMNSIRLLKI